MKKNASIKNDMYSEIRELIASARQRVAVTVNAELSLLYWKIGRRINEQILGHKRADYGKQVIQELSAKLTGEFGGGWSYRHLMFCVQFASYFPDLEIVNTLCSQLSWSHMKILLGQDDPLKREFCAEMRKLILELGGDMAFLAEQKRISVDNEDYYIDLLFYHRRLRRLVAIDLKIDSFKAEYQGQMHLYLKWLEKNEMMKGEKKPIGLILCAGKNEEHIRLLELDRSNIRVATYMTELPPREVLEEKFRIAIETAHANLQHNRELVEK